MRQFSERNKVYYEDEDTIIIWNAAQHAFYYFKALNDNRIDSQYIDEISVYDKDENKYRLGWIWKKSNYTHNLKQMWSEREH